MNPFAPHVSVFIAALSFDLLFGEYPEIIHPVAWMGRMADWFDQKSSSKILRFIYGILLLILDTTVWFSVAVFSFKLPLVLSFIVQSFLLKSAFSIRSLHNHVKDCQVEDTVKMRYAVSMLVSRNVVSLDKAHLISASLESMSENISDSIVAPLFYYISLGLPAAVAYRVINTLDAMIGYHTESFEWFGKASARTDDFVNLIPARLTASIIAIFSPKSAIRSIFKYAHTKLNAAYPMAAAAGVLGVWFEKIGVYRFDGKQPKMDDIKHGLNLFRKVVAVVLVLAIIKMLW